jgi:hypothetical protein
MLIAFPLVDDEAVMKVSAVVVDMLQPVNYGARVYLRCNPAGGFAVQPVQIVLPEIVRLNQIQQKMLVNACLQRRTKDMAYLSVVVDLHEAPVGQAFFPASVLQRKEQAYAAVVKVLLESFDIPLGSMFTEGSVGCRLHIADT